MPRVKSFLDCLALALYQKARKPLMGTGRWVDVMTDVARITWDSVHREINSVELTLALGEVMRMKPEQYSERMTATLDHLEELHPIPFRREMHEYLTPLPSLLRSYFQRPSDLAGTAPPKKWKLSNADDLLLMLPPRRSKLWPGREPKGLDNWKLVELVGFGELTEVWRVHDDAHPDHSSILKFVTDDDAAEAVRTHQDQFLEAFRLVHDVGIIPLRSVYLETNPPALESPYLPGYNLSSLMRDWEWKYNSPKPDATLRVMCRIAELVAKGHDKGVVHRDLKPSNILLHPTEGEKFTLWVAEFGWGSIASARSAMLSRGGTPRPEQQRLAKLGAHSLLYASPQQSRKDPPDPRDDVYAIGAIWYQLLARDPHATPPVGNDWAEDMPGVTREHSELLMACLATRPDKRPGSASELAKELRDVIGTLDSSKQVPLKSQSGEYPKLALSSDSKSNRSKTVANVQGTGYGGLPRYVTNSLGMTFSLIPPGEFEMGSAEEEIGRRAHEGPRHHVKITKPFYMGVFLVTQSQFFQVMNRNPSLFTKANGGGPDHPVDSVSWSDALHFCDKLSDDPEEEVRRRTYRLPTEAEWEYACRAGTITPFCYGEVLSSKSAHFATGGAFGKSGGVARTIPVGSLLPNGFGLYDMHGNLQEWVNDWYDEYYYHDSPAEDPTGPEKGREKVVRGGCYNMFGGDCRSAARKCIPPASITTSAGFRVVLMVPAKK